MKIAIVNYGMGNIHSIFSTLDYLGVSSITVTNSFEQLVLADKIILPGVGAFSEAMTKIKLHKLDESLFELVINQKKQILGICLGMQLLGNSSNEDGFNNGLGFIEGEVKKMNPSLLKIPHVGYNVVSKNKESILFDKLPVNSDFYFTHSYKMVSNIDLCESICNYGEDFIAAFEVENIFGVQFHPELSKGNGLKLLQNFIKL
jgi:glutamine amidotransferase